MSLHPFLDSPQPLLFAHRGSSGIAPENTLPAFEHAVGLGCTYLETDIHVTRDGVVVSFHDDRLDRVSAERGRIADFTMEELSRVNVGNSFTPDGETFPYRDNPVAIPRLEELLAAFPRERFNIDVKEDRAVLPLLRLLRSSKSLDRVCVGSFSDGRLRRLRLLTKGRICTSMGPNSVAQTVIEARFHRFSAHGADCVQIPRRRYGIELVTRNYLEAAHNAGIPVHVWTVNDIDEMEELLDLGVDGIMTDNPYLLRELLISRGQWHAQARGKR